MAAEEKSESWLSKHGVTLIAVVVTAVTTLLVSDYVNFSSSNREQVAQQQKNVEETAKQVSRLLQKFSDQATGRGKTTAEDYTQLKTLLLQLTEEARSLSERLPSTKSAYVQFTDAMIELRNAAGEMTGPLDAKPFVKAIANYYEHEFRFNKAVASAQLHYTFPSIWPDATSRTASPSA